MMGRCRRTRTRTREGTHVGDQRPALFRCTFAISSAPAPSLLLQMSEKEIDEMKFAAQNLAMRRFFRKGGLDDSVAW